MMRTLAKQDEELWQKISQKEQRLSMKQEHVPPDLLDSTAGIIFDSAPARLNTDVASR
jgi:hypothetical protein